jgi:hypothetical protein
MYAVFSMQSVTRYYKQGQLVKTIKYGQADLGPKKGKASRNCKRQTRPLVREGARR